MIVGNRKIKKWHGAKIATKKNNDLILYKKNIQTGFVSQSQNERILIAIIFSS